MANSKLPIDVRFLRAREAERSLKKAIYFLRLAESNLSDKDEPFAKDACRKALVKAASAHSRATEVYNRERLRVAPQIEMGGVK